MKSDLIPGRQYIECSCASQDHLLVFDICPLDCIDRIEVSVAFTSGYNETFLKRLKAAIRYIFKKEKYLQVSDSLILNEENINQLKSVVKEIEKLAKTKKLV